MQHASAQMSANRDTVHFARASAFARETENLNLLIKRQTVVTWSDIQNVGVDKLTVIYR